MINTHIQGTHSHTIQSHTIHIQYITTSDCFQFSFNFSSSLSNWCFHKNIQSIEDNGQVKNIQIVFFFCWRYEKSNKMKRQKSICSIWTFFIYIYTPNTMANPFNSTVFGMRDWWTSVWTLNITRAIGLYLTFYVCW